MFDNGLLVFDGGIGTELYERGFYINRPFEELNLNSPADVQAVHESYIQAGADVLTTNTFSITRPQLKKFDIEDKQAELIEAALLIANKAQKIKESVKIGLSIGPTGVLIEPLGPTSHDEARAFFAEVSQKALAAKAKGHSFDLYILETFSNINELADAITGIRSVDPHTPILASAAISSLQTDTLQSFVDKIASRDDVQALGLNCSQGPSHMHGVLEKLSPQISKPIVVQPNAGVPSHVNGRYFYMTSPDYLAKFAKRFVDLGAMGVGGCCGTGPLHISAIRNAIRMMKSRRVEVIQKKTETSVTQNATSQVDWTQRKLSRVGQLIAEKKKIISIEVVPPKGTGVEKFLENLQKIENAGVDFVNAPDSPRATTRISSLHLASFVNRDPNRKIKVIPHFTTRDRNLIAMQADLLGASLNSVHDILAVTGDPPKLGNNKEATAIYDIDSVGLTYLMSCLNKGVSPAGESLGSSTQFGIGVASNPTASNLDLETQRWFYKVESGADFAITQPIFDPDSYFRWLERISKQSRPHVVGIWPLISLRNAEFLANEVPGIKIPASLIDIMAKAENDPVESIKRGLDIAAKTMRAVESSSEGFCISAPLGKIEVALELLKMK